MSSEETCLKVPDFESNNHCDTHIFFDHELIYISLYPYLVGVWEHRLWGLKSESPLPVITCPFGKCEEVLN